MAENMQSYSYEGAKPITLVKWKIRKGSQLSQTVLFHYKQEAANSKEPILKFKSTIGGTVSELVAAEGEVIKPGTELLKFQPCSHPVIMKDLCGECGMDLRQMDRENFEKLTSATTFSMVHIVPELKVSLEQAEKLASDDEDRLLKNKKLVLLVDLDQTLIHTTNDQVPKELPDVHHFQLYGQHSPWYHTKLRPGTQTFLENISKYYELHICTFGARLYAHKIAQILDQDGKFFSHRILSRDECFDATSKTGNLKALFPRGDGMVCIIDDREDVWNFAPNVIRVKPYNYFRNTGDINAPPNKQVGNNPTPPNQNNTAVSKEYNTTTPNQNQASNVNKTEESGQLVPNQTNPAPDTALPNENKVIEPKRECPETKETMQQNGEAPSNDSTKQNVAIGTDSGNKDVQNTDGNSGEKSEEKNAAAEKKEGDVVPEKPIDTYWDDHHADDYLLYLEEILMSVHKTYYEMHSKMIKDKQKGIPDLKMVVPYVRQRVLKNTNIVFSSVIPTNCVPENHYLWSLAESLGAQVSRELELKHPELRTTHVVASKEGTVKVNVARKHKKIHVVSLEWLLCCADRWEHADERLFPLEENEANELSLNDSINARAKQFKSLKRKHNKEEPKEDDDNFSERIFVEAGLSLSKEDIEDMDKEIDDACSVESSESDSSSSSSSIESLSSGDYPKGWKKRKRTDVTAQELENETAETSDAETIGSVDEEMAEAVKQEFNSF